MRKAKSKKRYLAPDPQFGETLVTRFVNNLMICGKKAKAYGIFYNSLDIVQEKTQQSGLDQFKKALSNVTPSVEVRSRRVGGATFQIPQEIRPERRVAMAMKWLIDYARERNEHAMSQKLAGEIISAAKEEGAAFKKKEDVHRMAEANKAYSHFRF